MDKSVTHAPRLRSLLKLAAKFHNARLNKEGDVL